MIAPERASDVKITVLNPVGFPPAITRNPERLLSYRRISPCSHTITRSSAPVASLGYLIASRSHPIALFGRTISCGRCIQTSTRVPNSHLSRMVRRALILPRACQLVPGANS